ncbi:hypothetical protein [Actibacterium sp. 188UL27-1]|uniref:hypothetical protein n=1 Tax=Actibacterium sp. 188UL27-1 TaxID=2786961 RepID=UPI001957F742|nr:hypothetical protein [Actibacterium sp. 188UL27-1]MBM7066368.1 hypothetical protein [Actibacterium sp. 188UL27-1]
MPIILPSPALFPEMWAKAAVRHTRSIMGIPSNKLGDGSENACLAEVRRNVAAAGMEDSATMTDRLATHASANKCGNCGEYAAVTFQFLKRRKCPFLLELAYYEKGSLDHAFVIINRDDTAPLSTPSKWGDHCWIADAWSNDTIHGKTYRTNMVALGGSVPDPKVSTWHVP